MRTARNLLAAAILWGCGTGTAPGNGDPAGKWLSVYAWIQTGERLAGAEQWPLALGAYLEAGRQIGELAEAHPAFEPEMVAYRRALLDAAVVETEARLTTDEHETMMKFLDFVESLALGETQRYAEDYEAAHATLAMAESLLGEIVEQKPASFRDSVEPLRARLESSLSWVGEQIRFEEANRPVVLPPDEGFDRGTTRFVKAGDLPKADPAPRVDSTLFPPGPAATGDAEVEKTGAEGGLPLGGAGASGETAVRADAAPCFRMNRRQAGAPARPEGPSAGSNGESGPEEQDPPGPSEG